MSRGTSCQIVYTGKENLQRVGRILTQMKSNYKVIGNEIVDTNAEMYYDALIETIESQNFAPLSPEYRKRKGLLGLDTRILIATGEYMSSIRIKRVNAYGSGNVAARHVGVDEGQRHSGTNLSMGDLAIIHEYGTSDGRIPARPHYSKAWDTIYPQIRNNTLNIARKLVKG